MDEPLFRQTVDTLNMNEPLFRQIVGVLENKSIPVPMTEKARQAARDLKALNKWRARNNK